MPLRPHSSLSIVARILVLTLLVLILFWTGALLLGSLTAWLRGDPVAGGGLVSRCAICGLIAALFVTLFHLRQHVLRLRAEDSMAFLARVTPVLTELGYVAHARTDGRHVFRPGFRSFLFGSVVEIEVKNGQATITGPRVYLQLLRRRLRVRGYVEQAIKAPACREERLLRRVELELRIEPDQWPALHGGVIEALQHVGAEVVCRVHILAHAEGGFREADLEKVRGWLARQDIFAEVHKEPFSLPVSGLESTTTAAEPAA